MKNVAIPYSNWQPLRPSDVAQLFADAPFMWGLAGGYAIEQFLGAPIREHGDIDVVVYRDQQLQAQSWLADWRLYAADPPGTLRPWIAGEHLPYGIHDIWGHRAPAQAWELQLMLAETDQDHWWMRRHPQIRGQRDNFFVVYNGIPCVRVEVQLLYKAQSSRAKDTCDFLACLPHLTVEARQWITDKLLLLYPSGHPWLQELS